jgi:hypothetical protein
VRAGRPGWFGRWPLLLTGTLAAAAAVLIQVGGLTERGATTRSKGDPRLDFFVATKTGGVQRGAPGDTLVPGSRVQFVYSHPTRVWLAVVSRDGAGRASIYFPEGGRTAAELPAGREQPLPVSTVLDEALGPEQIFGLFCQAPVALAPVRDALARGATDPPVPPGCRLSRLTWVKRPSP